MSQTRAWSDRRQLRKNRVKIGARCQAGQHAKCCVLGCECKVCGHGISFPNFIPRPERNAEGTI